jgi:hypothetical protein
VTVVGKFRGIAEVADVPSAQHSMIDDRFCSDSSSTLAVTGIPFPRISNDSKRNR